MKTTIEINDKAIIVKHSKKDSKSKIAKKIAEAITSDVDVLVVTTSDGENINMTIKMVRPAEKIIFIKGLDNG